MRFFFGYACYVQLKNIYRGLCATVTDLVKVLIGPKYDGKYLHKLIRSIVGDKRLSQTLTNVIIPTFDIKTLLPVIFSSYQVVFHSWNLMNCMYLFLTKP